MKKVKKRVVPEYCEGCIRNPKITGRACNVRKEHLTFLKQNGFCPRAQAIEPLKKEVEVEVATGSHGPEEWLTELVLSLARQEKTGISNK